MKGPSKKQIEYANAIAETLGIDFPISDADFTASAYLIFIKKNEREFKDTVFTSIPDIYADDDDVCWGYDFGLWEY